MTRALLLVLALLLAACLPPPVPTSCDEPVTHVAIVDAPDGLTGWRPEHRAAIAAVLPRLTVRGNRWALGPRESADVEVRTFDSGGLCARGVGAYTAGDRFVVIDPACATSLVRLQWAVAHELLHELTYRRAHWLGHVCPHANDGADCHPSVTGLAVLGPVMPANFTSDGSPAGEPDPVPTDTDRALLEALGVR